MPIASDVLVSATAAVVLGVFLVWLGPPPVGRRYRRAMGVVVRKTMHDAAPDGPDVVTVLIQFMAGEQLHRVEYVASSWLGRVVPGDAVRLRYRCDNPSRLYLADAVVLWWLTALALAVAVTSMVWGLLAG